MIQRKTGSSTGALIPTMPMISTQATSRASGLCPPVSVPRSMRRIIDQGLHGIVRFHSLRPRITTQRCNVTSATGERH
jgi:hypothetical protein